MRSEKQLDIGLWEQISQPVLFFQRTDWEIFPHDGGYSLDSSFSMKADTGIGDWGLRPLFLIRTLAERTNRPSPSSCLSSGPTSVADAEMAGRTPVSGAVPSSDVQVARGLPFARRIIQLPSSGGRPGVHFFFRFGVGLSVYTQAIASDSAGVQRRIPFEGGGPFNFGTDSEIVDKDSITGSFDLPALFADQQSVWGAHT